MTGSIRNFEKLNFTPKSSVFCSSQGQTSKYDRLAHIMTDWHIHDNIESSGKVILKIDFKNAFNSISRNKFLSLIHERYPGLYPYAHAAHDSASHLFIGDSALSSEEGGQQGDPEAPPIFCDTVNEITHKVESELNLWYLDDGNLGGDYAIVLRDFLMIISESTKLGLEVRPDKCELYFLGNSSETQRSLILSEFNKISPLIETPGIDNLIILGALVGNLAISNVLSDKIAELEFMCLRLKNIEVHHAFFLLKSSFSIPKLIYILRSSPCFNYPELLAKYDDLLYSSLESICNIRLDTDARKQASLPVALGGLGLGSESVLAVCGYLSSVGSSSRLCSEILNKPFSDPLYEGALSQWYELSGSTTIPENNFQKSWSDPVYRTRLNNLITDAPDKRSRIRLKSFEGKLQSAWLTALQSSSLGLKLSNIHLRISLALRLGEPHVCRYGEHVDTFGGHGLSCRRSAGRLQRHSMINDIVKRALGSSNILSVL